MDMISHVIGHIPEEELKSLDEGVTIKHGQALIQYLDTDTYYVLEEYKVPDGYKMPERESDRYTLFKIEESDNGMSVETKIYNTENTSSRPSLYHKNPFTSPYPILWSNFI